MALSSAGLRVVLLHLALTGHAVLSAHLHHVYKRTNFLVVVVVVEVSFTRGRKATDGRFSSEFQPVSPTSNRRAILFGASTGELVTRQQTGDSLRSFNR